MVSAGSRTPHVRAQTRGSLPRRGILINLVANLDGTKAVIDASFECKKHFERLMEIEPDAAIARHMLGMWHWEAANVGWFARKVTQPACLTRRSSYAASLVDPPTQAAAAFFGVPPEGSFEDARDHFLAAEELYAQNGGIYMKARTRQLLQA